MPKEHDLIVAFLRALPESHRVGGQVVGTGYSPAAVRALLDAADAIERGEHRRHLRASIGTLATQPQPLPSSAEGDVWAEIIETLPEGLAKQAAIARRQMGIDKYGVPLQRGNGRSHAVDEAQELLDAAVYRAARFGAGDTLVRVYLSIAADILADIS